MNFETLATEVAENAASRLDAEADVTDMADALLTTAVSIAKTAIGPAATAAWLRKLADHVEGQAHG